MSYLGVTGGVFFAAFVWTYFRTSIFQHLFPSQVPDQTVRSYRPHCMEADMLVEQQEKIALCNLGAKLGLISPEMRGCTDKRKKTEQILAFLEAIETSVRKYSSKRELSFIDSGAGSSALSFFAYHYYTVLKERPIRIKCIDTNTALMEKGRLKAQKLGFSQMKFQSGDILEHEENARPDVVYALHACDTATDKAIALGVRTGARNILTVSCCQHSFSRSIRGNEAVHALMSRQVFRDKMTYMVADTMRALLLEMVGYHTTVVEFVSSRATDKNIMVRARRTNLPPSASVIEEYLNLRRSYGTSPRIEGYLQQYGLLPESILR